MSDAAIGGPTHRGHAHPDHDPGRPNFTGRTGISGIITFAALLVIGLGFVLHGLSGDIAAAGGEAQTVGGYILLGLALLIALGFEFVNGFHDTANAVATVIYTYSLPPQVAVIWSGLFNFLGVLLSSGAVAFAVVNLLPVELILQMGSSAGFAMIFALLFGAIIWNLGTWWLGLPASSSHTLIGSIIGVGLANQLMAEPASGVSGVDWSQVGAVFRALLFSPVIGFISAALLFLAMKLLIRSRTLFIAPVGKQPPPPAIRAVLVATCTVVSFAHGSNDGQKGMGLIMLILIGVLPTTYALNRVDAEAHMPGFILSSENVSTMFAQRAPGVPPPPIDAAREQLADALRLRKVDAPDRYAALAVVAGDIVTGTKKYGALGHVPQGKVQSIRNEAYMVSEAIRLLRKAKIAFTPAETATLTAFKQALDNSTRFLPLWVKVATAIALGLGTMVGWKRIVVTVGEKIGKTHMNYAQGASAEVVAALTIGAADLYGLPVSTTHVLASGVAGSMAACGAGLQWATVRSMVLAWVLTLPAAMLLSGVLYFVLRSMG